MAYNPFDDIIDSDPAYMQTGGRTVIPQRRADYTQETFKPIATAISKGYQLLTPEQETKDEIEKNKQLRQLATAQALKGTQFEEYAGQADLPSAVIQSPGIMERLQQAGYKPQGFIEGMSRIGEFFYGDQRQAFDKLSQGQQLTDQDRTAIALSPLDSLDFLFPPLAIKKLGSMGLKTVDDVLKSTADIEEVKQIKNYFGGQGFTPAGVMREPEVGPKPISFRKFSPYDFKKLNKTIKDIKSGKLKPNQGPNKYGLDKNRTNELLRQSPDTNFDYSKLEFPIEELQNLIPRQANFIEAGKYLENLKGKKTFKELFEEGFTRDSIDQARKRNPELTDKIEFSKFSTPGERLRNLTTIMNKNKKELGLTKTAKMMGDDREEAVLFDGLFRSLEPENLGLSPDVDKKVFGEKFIDFMKGIDWKKQFAEDLDTIKVLDKQRIQGDKTIKEMFNNYKKRFPKQFKDLNVNDFKLQIAHNFPLRAVKGQFQGVGGLKGSSRLSFARTNILSHQEIENSFKEIINAANEQGGKLTSIQQEALDLLDKRAKKLGTVAYGKISPEGLEGDEFIKVGMEEQPGLTSLIESLENYFKQISKQKNYKPKKVSPKGGVSNLASGFVNEDIPVQIIDELKMAKGGPVKMAKGGLGSVLENMNQQNFTPDPAIDGDSAFQQAVKSENLYAFNPSKILKFFGDKVPGVFTPSKRNKNMELMSDAPSAPGTTLPVEQPIQDYDFAFKSFTLDKVNSKNAPKAAKPQDWINFLQGGDIAPKAEILDSGLFQYMEDFERYYPNQKLTREQITEFYEQSPISNLQVKVKAGRDDASPYDVMSQETMGRARHKNAGSARIDEGGENYREIVIEAGALPGEEKPFISSGHFEEPNVLVFSRVADYKNADGQNVSVIQEMQTDLLTKVRKEQERLAAAIGEAKVKLAANQRVIEQGDAFDNYRMNSANQNIQQLSQQIPKLEQLAETKLIKPYPLTVAKELIPTYEKQLLDLQQEINALAQAGVDRTDPEFLMKISQIEQQQQGTLNELLNLNRSKNFETLTQDVKVPTASNSEELQQIAQNQSSYHTTRPIETFPPIPFNNQADYVDLILKATIKDAENRGVNKIAIMPADVGANPRWNKNNEDARKKFQNLYDKVGVQQLKNIAKKYGGSVEIEKISDPTKSTMGIRVSKPSLNRDSFDFLKDVDVDRRAVENDPEGARNFLDEEIIRIASDLGDKSVIYRKETAPGQTMDYYVDLYTVNTDRETVKKYNLVPLDPDDVDTNAQILIEDYNPSLVDMFVLTMDEGKQKAPMYMFKKKEGGIIPEDRLVSITDIYGDY